MSCTEDPIIVLSAINLTHGNKVMPQKRKEKKSRSLNTQTKIKTRYAAPTLISKFLQFYLFTTDGYIQRCESRQRITSQRSLDDSSLFNANRA